MNTNTTLSDMDKMRAQIRRYAKYQKVAAIKEPEEDEGEGYTTFDLRKGFSKETKQHIEAVMEAIFMLPDGVPSKVRRALFERFQQVVFEVAADQFKYGLELGRDGY